MSVTTSARINTDVLESLLPRGFSWFGPMLHEPGEKTILGDQQGYTDQQLQAAVTQAASRFVDRDANLRTLQQRAHAALAANKAFLAIPAPTAAQVRDQVIALTKQQSGALRMLIGELDQLEDAAP